MASSVRTAGLVLVATLFTLLFHTAAAAPNPAAASKALALRFQKTRHLGTSRPYPSNFLGSRRSTAGDTGAHGLEPRTGPGDDLDDDIVHQLLQNKGVLYLVNVTVGTPPQEMQLQIDTASSDIWVLSKSIPACLYPTDYYLHGPVCGFGSFDATASSTFELLGRDRFSILYVDGSNASGDYASDIFSVGGATVQGMQIGVANQANISYGVMGVGFEGDQASASPGGMGRYPNLVSRMVSQGLINSRAFSLWLDDIASDTGSILFGGIDTARFVGNLTSIPIELAPGQIDPLAFAIPLTSVAFSDGKSHINITSKYLPTTVVLDSGSSLTFLPHPVASLLAEKVSAKFSHQLNLYVINCSYPTTDVYVKYTFSFAMNIKVPMSELILPLTKYSGGVAKNENGADICVLGILPSKGSISIFGDTFLRSAYVVFDLDNKRVALGQTEFDPIGQEIVEIGVGEDSVPHVGFQAMTIMATGTIDITSTQETGLVKSAAWAVAPMGIWRFIALVFSMTVIIS